MSETLSNLTPVETAIAATAAVLRKVGFTYSEEKGEFEREGCSIELKSLSDYTHVGGSGKAQRLSAVLTSGEQCLTVIGKKQRGVAVGNAVFARTGPAFSVYVSIATAVEDVLRRIGDPFPHTMCIDDTARRLAGTSSTLPQAGCLGAASASPTVSAQPCGL